MKRFVDIRNQGTGDNFAWFDTVSDVFEEHGGFMSWINWDDFARDCESDLERYFLPVCRKESCRDEALARLEIMEVELTTGETNA